MKAKDAGPMKGFEDWKVENVPAELVHRLEVVIAAEGLSARGWWIEAAERTVAAYEAMGGK